MTSMDFCTGASLANWWHLQATSQEGGALQIHSPDGGGWHRGSGGAEVLPGLRGSRASSGSGRVLEGLARQKPRGGNGGGQLGPWGPSQGWGLGRSNLLSEPWEGWELS